jgi:Holliday junction resolvasome RuvABC endonuclease subunit
MNPPAIHILGIDPGTHLAGVVLAQCTRSGFRPIRWAAVGATSPGHSLTDRSIRVAEMRESIEGWLKELPPVDVVGCEWPFYSPKTKNAVTEALFMVCGGILSLPCLLSATHHDIAPGTAKNAYHGSQMTRYPAKNAAMAWARNIHRLPIGDCLNSEAIADALAVCEATWGVWRTEQMAKDQPPLFGPGSRKLRQVKVASNV